MSLIFAFAIPETGLKPILHDPQKSQAEYSEEIHSLNIKVIVSSYSSKLREQLAILHKSFRVLTEDMRVFWLILTSLVARLGRQSLAVLLQYVSKRYGWSLAQN
ncbi:MAG: hypothetical protein M1834_007979 [Cirrosporium novae-zelandiae]|nr:MAG: hypothetical protein M1834_007979 [Cirrosporium novae-zelandiae]